MVSANATTREKGMIIFWDRVTGKELRRIPYQGNGEACTILALAFSPDGKTLATGGYDRSVRLWEVASGEEHGRFVGHRNFVSALAAPETAGFWLPEVGTRRSWSGI